MNSVIGTEEKEVAKNAATISQKRLWSCSRMSSITEK